MHEAKTHLSRLVAAGEFIIARDGRPVARVTPIASGSPNLSNGARSLIEDQANEMVFSVVSLWEVAIKAPSIACCWLRHPVND